MGVNKKDYRYYYLYVFSFEGIIKKKLGNTN